MRIIFVRHGHPDYKLDCLTEAGHEQAQAAAHRLEFENIKTVYASTRGRALETAEHIAKMHGLDVVPCDFMREIGWGSLTDEPIFQNGHPWHTANHMVANGQSVVDPAWADQEPFCKNRVIQSVQKVEEGFDGWLAGLGYERDGAYYRVRRTNTDTIVMVSHAGSSSAAIAHLFNMPFPLMCAAMDPSFTAVTVITFDGEEGSLISPHVEIMNDARHIAGIDTHNVYAQ